MFKQTRMRRTDFSNDATIYYGVFYDEQKNAFNQAVIGIDQYDHGFVFNKLDHRSVPNVKIETVSQWRDAILNKVSYIHTSKGESIADFSKVIKRIDSSRQAKKSFFIAGSETDGMYTLADNISIVA